MIVDILQASGFSVIDKSPDDFTLKNLSPAYRCSSEILISFMLGLVSSQLN